MKFNFKDFRQSITDEIIHFHDNKKTYILGCLALIFIMIFVFTAVFFISVKGPEEVMVPNVVGKELTQALLDMQIKELYPRIQLRHSNSITEKGTILEQNPSAGAIVKAGRRINLIVSQGLAVEAVEDFVGQNIDDVKFHLQTLASPGNTLPMVIEEPILYVHSESPAGTILEQEPLSGTPIVDQTKLTLVVSKGPEGDKTLVPNLLDLSVSEILALLPETKLAFNFTAKKGTENQRAGVVAQTPDPLAEAEIYSRVEAEFIVPEISRSRMVTNIFTENLPEYPYPVDVKLEYMLMDGTTKTLVEFKHPGGLLTIPYSVPQKSILVLTIMGKELKRVTVK
ncbi:MAG: PASTA domain-containing protein [Spirochaetaceae bacterium]|nr:PASTA domain-containing protein [Spirochaetaceae bacterium]